MAEMVDFGAELVRMTADMAALTAAVWRDAAGGPEGLPTPRVAEFLGEVAEILAVYEGVPGPRVGREQREGLGAALLELGRRAEELWVEELWVAAGEGAS